MTQTKRTEELAVLIAEAQKMQPVPAEAAGQRGKILRGMLPICAACKQIRDDKAYWKGVEAYIAEHSEAVFTSGICPDCEKKIYEELEKLKNENA